MGVELKVGKGTFLSMLILKIEEAHIARDLLLLYYTVNKASARLGV